MCFSNKTIHNHIIFRLCGRARCVWIVFNFNKHLKNLCLPGLQLSVELWGVAMIAQKFIMVECFIWIDLTNECNYFFF